MGIEGLEKRNGRRFRNVKSAIKSGVVTVFAKCKNRLAKKAEFWREAC